MSGGYPFVNEGLDPGDNQVFDVKDVAPVARPYRVTGTGQVINGPCLVYGFSCTAGTSPTLTLYDGLDASGVLLSGGATETVGAVRTFPAAIMCATGLHAAAGGTGPGFTIFALPSR